MVQVRDVSQFSDEDPRYSLGDEVIVEVQSGLYDRRTVVGNVCATWVEIVTIFSSTI